MPTLTGREHRAIADVLAEVARQPGVNVAFMQKVVRHTIDAAIAEDPLILYPAWFRDRTIRPLTELPKQQVATLVSNGKRAMTKTTKIGSGLSTNQTVVYTRKK